MSISSRALLFAGLLALAPRHALHALQAPAGGGAVSLSFVETRLADVIRTLASAVGLSVVLSDVPDKRISFSTSAPVPRDDIGAVLEGILEANGLVLVRQGAVAQVMPAEKAPPTGMLRVGTTLESPAPVGLITQLVPLQSIGAAEAAAALKPFTTAATRMEAVARTNALLITDRGMNVARYLELLRKLDERPQGEAGLRTYVVPLKYAQAEDLAMSLGQLFGVVVASSRGNSLDDRSLSRNLDGYRMRDMDAFALRQNIAAAAQAAATNQAGRDSAARSGNLVGQTTIVPHLPSNSLIVRSAAPNFPLLRETIEQLDVRPAQVLLEVTVAEIALGKNDQFGVDWSVIGGSTTARNGTPAPVDSNTAVEGLFLRVVDLRGANVRAVLRAIATRSNVRVLSTPEILAVNNREARIVVGSRVPFISSTRLGFDVAIDRSVQYQDVGTTLTIIPTINQDDHVSVQILQEVSALTNQTIRAALDAPVISTREASTRAIIRDGRTVVIGGLIGTQIETVERGVPVLMHIPIIGNLFKTQSLDRTRSELAIFVTPYIIRTDEDAEAIRRRVRDRMNEQDPRAVPEPANQRRPPPPER